MSCCKERETCKNCRRETYRILGNPIPLARPRFARGRVFDSQRLVKLNVTNHLIDQHGDREKFRGPVHMEVSFFMPIPVCSKAKKLEFENRLHKQRPDFSNLLKFIEDAALEVLYHDDCIISSVCGSKMYSVEPRTELTITELK